MYSSWFVIGVYAFLSPRALLSFVFAFPRNRKAKQIRLCRTSNANRGCVPPKWYISFSISHSDLIKAVAHKIWTSLLLKEIELSPHSIFLHLVLNCCPTFRPDQEIFGIVRCTLKTVHVKRSTL